MININDFLKNVIVPYFDVDGTVMAIESPSSIGNINSTFVIICQNQQGKINKYILQKINTKVFNNPRSLMKNIQGITSFMKQKNPNAEKLELIPLKKPTNGETNLLVYQDFLQENNYWRMYNYISNSISYDVTQSPEIFRQVGRGFAQFHKDLSDYPVNNPEDKLEETIPNFHNTRGRYLNFLDTCKRTKATKRFKNCIQEINYIRTHNHDYSIITELIEEGIIPIRVTHNDTKINNILLDKTTQQVKCVIDLDTVMPGTALYDIGDAVRSGASTVAEDELDLSKVKLNLDLVEAFLNGYLEIMAGELTEQEIKNIPNAIQIITLELAIRFLDDYLNGDQYFIIKDTTRPQLNLERARNQIALARDIELKKDRINDLVTSLTKQYRFNRKLTPKEKNYEKENNN